MRIRKSFTLKWWETSLFKISMISLGLLVGASWPQIFLQFRSVLIVLFVVPSAYLTWVWWKQ
jgi:hypothetical protein